MARVHRRGHRGTEVDVAQPEHQVVGLEHDATHVLDAFQAVDAADELDVAGAPWRIGTHRLHVLLDGQARGAVVPGQRERDDARGNRQLAGIAQRLVGSGQRVDQSRAS